MLDHRQIYCVRHGMLIVGFEYAEQAAEYARTVGSSWEPVRLYLSGKMPRTWTVHTAEAGVWLDGDDNEPEVLNFDSYVTSDLEGTPHEEEPCVVVLEEYDDRRWCRAFGTDKELVRQRVEEWYAVERLVKP